MNNNEFDKLIKERLEGFSATPSEQVGKRLSRKMFFRNIWFFHKSKALFILIFISGVAAFNLCQTEENRQLLTKKSESATHHNKNVKKQEIKSSDKTRRTFSPVEKDNQKLKQSGHKKEQIAFEDKREQQTTNVSLTTPKNSITTNNKQKRALQKSRNKRKSLTHQLKQQNLPLNNLEQLAANGKNAKRTATHNKKSQSEWIEKEISINNKETLRKFKKKDFKEMALPPLTLQPFESKNYDLSNNEDYAKKHQINFSFDAYMTPYNKVNIINQVDKKYEANWWDFYTNKGYQNSGMEFGVRGNAEWKNIIFSLGVQNNRIIDYKPMYKHEEIEGDFLEEAFELDEISGVQILAKDSAHYVFYTEDNEELINHLENDKFNTYSYASIPVSLGYQFHYSVFTLALSGGFVYNRVTGVKGTYLKRYQNNEKFDIYYNKGIETSLLYKQNDMLRSSFISYLGTATLNIAISSSFDCFGELNYTVGKTPITNEGYIITKKYSNYGINFGVRYHLNARLKGNQSSVTSF